MVLAGIVRRWWSAGCLRHSLLIRQPICVRAATRTMTARLGVGALIQRGGRAVAGMLTIATAGGS